MYGIKRTQQANIDLYKIYNYIFFNLANPIAADNFRADILKSISNLQIFPFMGKRYNKTEFRFIYFKNYLIFYSVKDQNVEIQRILNKRQNFKNIIKKMKF